MDNSVNNNVSTEVKLKLSCKENTMAEKTNTDPKISNRLQKISEGSEYDPPDGGYGWVIVLASFFANSVVDGTINSFGIFLSPLVKEFKVSEGKIAWVGSFLSGVTLLVGPLASAMANRYGCRITCITGSILSSAAFGLSIFCSNVALLMATYLVAGIGLGLILLPAIVFVGFYFESKRALATGIALSGSGFGTFIFPPIVNYILDVSDWKTANLCLAGAILTCTIFGSLLKPLKPRTSGWGTELNTLPTSKLSQLKKSEESKSTIDVSFSNMSEYMLYKKKHKQVQHLTPHRNRSQSNVAEYYAFRRRGSLVPITRHEIFYSGSLMQVNIPINRNPEKDSKDNLKSLLDFKLLKDVKFLLFAFLNIFAMASFYIPLVYIVDYAKIKQIEARKASFLLSVIGIINTVARTAFGYIVNFPSVDSIFVNNVWLFIGAISVGVIPFCESYVAFIITSVFFGISLAAYSSLTPIILVDLLGLAQLTHGFGIIQLFRGITALLGTPTAGILLDWTHLYSVPFFVGGGLYIVSSLFGIILQFVHRRRSVKIEIESVT